MDVVVPINYFAVLVAAILNIVLGFLWYGPLFGKQWMKLSGMSKEKIESMKKKGMTKTYVMVLVSSFVMSYVLAHALVFASGYLKVYGLSAGIMSGFWNWIGFVAPVILGPVLWEGRPYKLWILNSSYYLVSLLLMGSILAVWI